MNKNEINAHIRVKKQPIKTEERNKTKMDALKSFSYPPLFFVTSVFPTFIAHLFSYQIEATAHCFC